MFIFPFPVQQSLELLEAIPLFICTVSPPKTGKNINKSKKQVNTETHHTHSTLDLVNPGPFCANV